MSAIQGLAGIVGLLIGGILIIGGGWNWWTARRITAGEQMPDDEIETARRVIIEGEVVDADDPFKTSLTETSYAVLNAWGIEKGKRENGRRQWIETTGGVDATPFVVESEKGLVRVEPTTFTQRGFGTPVERGVTGRGCHSEISTFGTRERVEADNHDPPEVRRFLETHPNVTVDDSVPHRFKDGTITIGDSVTVIGKAIPINESNLDAVFRSTEDGRPLVVADREYDSLKDKIATAKSITAVGLLISTLGGVFYWGLL